MPTIRRLLTLLSTACLSAASASFAATADDRDPVALGGAELVSTMDTFVDTVNGLPVTVSDRDGRVTALWKENYGLKAAQRDPHGRWSKPVTLGSCFSAGPSADCVTGDESLAVDGRGTVTALWAAYNADAGATGIHLSTLAPGGAWSTPIVLNAQEHRFGGHSPHVAASANGAAIATYSSVSRGHGRTVHTFYKPVGATWQEAQPLIFDHAQTSQVTMGPGGQVLLVIKSGPAIGYLRAYRYVPASGWSAPTYLGRTGDGSYDLSMGPGGRAVLAWAADLDHPRLEAAIMSREGDWRPVSSLTPTVGYDSFDPPRVAIRGTATVMWSSPRAAIRTDRKRPTGPWQLERTYPRGTGLLQALSVNRRGDLSALWAHWEDPKADLVGALQPAGGAWSTPVVVPNSFAGENSGPLGSVVTMPDASALVVTTMTSADQSSITGQATVQVVARQVTPDS